MACPPHNRLDQSNVFGSPAGRPPAWRPRGGAGAATGGVGGLRTGCGRVFGFPDRRDGITDRRRRNLWNGGDPVQDNRAGRDQRRRRHQRAPAGTGGRGLQVQRPGRDKRLQQAHRCRGRADHPWHLVQRRHAGRCAAGRARRRDPVLWLGIQPRHRQRRRLHIPDPDQRYRSRRKHGRHPLVGWHPPARDDFRGDRLRCGNPPGYGGGGSSRTAAASWPPNGSDRTRPTSGPS